MKTFSQAAATLDGFPIPPPRPTSGPKLRRLSLVDLPSSRDFAEQLSAEDVYRRFGTSITDAESLARRLTLFGRPDSETYAIAAADGSIAAIGNLAPTRSGEAELALIVRSDLKRRGFGTSLLRGLMARARESGIRRLIADVLSDNAGMVTLARSHGAIFDGFSSLHLELHFDLLPWPSTLGRATSAQTPAWSLQ